MAETVKIYAAIITASDSRTVHEDVSGHLLGGLLESIGATVVHHSVVCDDLDLIREALLSFTDTREVNLIVTTGGTGLGPRDNTPEATLTVIEREVPGIAEAIRRETALQTPFAILSRGVAGTRNGTLIINLPGSPKGVEECFAVVAPILGHAVRMATGDTNH
ncbi:MAG: MogA/MoaB family molybdenum cofactor biosynthesis protein [bacterium]|nr:MogA/MoaB family molybdenum cofactor biosynthesis protein [bacterium]